MSRAVAVLHECVCGERRPSAQSLGQHKRRCVQAQALKAAQAEGSSRPRSLVAQIRQEVELEQATIAVLGAKFPKGARPEDWPRVVALVKGIDRA